MRTKYSMAPISAWPTAYTHPKLTITLTLMVTRQFANEQTQFLDLQLANYSTHQNICFKICSK